MPADPLKAAQAGASAGLEYRQQNLQAEQHAAALAQAAQQAQMENQINREKIEGTLAEAKARTNLEAEQAAKKYAAQSEYQRAITGGMDPTQAAMQYFPLMGENLSGVAPLAAEKFRADQMAKVPQAFMGPDGEVAGYQLGNRMILRPPPKPVKATVPQGLIEQMKGAQTLLKNAVMAKDITAAKAEVDRLATEMNKYHTGGPAADGSQIPNVDDMAGSTNAPAFDYEYDIKTGKFNPVGQ